MGWMDRWNRSEREDRVIIVGAGITGLAAAIALQRAGRRVVVLEQRPAVGHDVRSIVLTEHDAELLDDQGLAGDVLRQSVPFREHTMDLGSPTPMAPLRTAGSPWPRVMPRRSLAELLEQEAYWAGARLVYRTQVATAHATDHAADVLTAEGHRLTSPTLIGADGPESVVRRAHLHAPMADSEPHTNGGEASSAWTMAGTTPLRALDPLHLEAAENGATLTYSDQHRWFFAQITDPSDDTLSWMAQYRSPAPQASPGISTSFTAPEHRRGRGIPAVAGHIIERSDAVRVRQTHPLPPSLLSLPPSIRLLGSARDGGHRTSEPMGAHALSEALSTPSRKLTQPRRI